MTTKITEKNISGIANSAVQWQSVITADGSTNTTAVAGQGYFIDTSSAAHTIVLPASPNVGDTIQIRDYASSFATNKVTLDINGLKLAGISSNGEITTNDTMATLVYSGATKGWLSVENEAKANLVPPVFTSATGGTVATSGDYKTHIFTSSGCFVVSQIGNAPSAPAGGPVKADYFVVAGGGSGGGTPGAGDGGGGGGGGGFRLSLGTAGGISATPLSTTTDLSLTSTTYPVTVGAGGVGDTGEGAKGSDSIFSTITSAGGGGGEAANTNGSSVTVGGSGGGLHQQTVSATLGAGNTPPVSPPQGNPGGDQNPTGSPNGGGGGGAGASGEPARGDPVGNAGGPPGMGGGAGGAGSYIPDAFIGPTAPSYGTPGPVGSSRFFSGGGGGASSPSRTANQPPSIGPAPPGGGGGASGPTGGGAGNAGTSNTGGGGGAAVVQGNNAGNGGSGVVMIRYKYQ